MVQCDRCGDSVQDYVQCSSCKKVFDYPCSGITEQGFRKLGADRQAVWKCPSCKQGTPKVGRASKPISETLKATSESATGPCGLCITSPTPTQRTPVTLEQVMAELNSIKKTLAPLLNVMEGIQEIKNEILETKTSVSEVSSKLQSLKERLLVVERARDDATKLEDRISRIEADVNERNQWTRLNNIEIKGVPIKERENLLEIVSKLGAKIMYPVAKQNINFVTRVLSQNNKSKPIIVSFVNRYFKEDFVAAARQFKKLYPCDIGLQGLSQIFVNDHLTVQNKMLLTDAKKIAKEHNYEYVWVKNSKIFARKNSSSKVIAIKGLKDLDKIH
ncbi:uncharacterized protein LOC126381350 [Pectinophora gossypiella]|uniref:uncharacterized protein LOC126381348 n=1 Tax=Pectinophora gossypiella TaxID=13191 RepID=UPI00214EDAAB|nr:uncharacterized protein LOC126381348 [Pectinophora gossypiella]XP_049886803.1 uncharacterized protein LOC126381350 [Pectinophora gossypiella]